MKLLSDTQLCHIAGGGDGFFWGTTIGATYGAYQGGVAGFVVTAPVGLIILGFSLRGQQGVIWPGVAMGFGSVVAGTAVGSLIGATFYGTMGAVGGTVVDLISNAHHSSDNE